MSSTSLWQGPRGRHIPPRLDPFFPPPPPEPSTNLSSIVGEVSRTRRAWLQRGGKAPFEVIPEVAGVLEAHREADEV
ncbi:MAG TPA: hypothetical protein VMT52_05495, partial [Planctomycetota bacterium]|nr:hypothetical protein [Planctomycetota bacterium]